MENHSQVRLTLGIDAEREPITGWIEDDLGSRRDFVGMLELVALLEGARRPHTAEGSVQGNGP